MLDQCPRCDYSLKGLPANHACPECGLRYDEQSEVYRAGGRWSVARAPWRSTAAFVAMLGGMVYLAVAARSLLRTVSAGSAMLAALVFVWLLVRARRAQPMVAVLPDGLYVRLPDVRAGLISWNMLHSPTHAQAENVILVSRRDSIDPLCLGGLFASRADAQRLARQIQSRATEACRKGGGAPVP